MTAPASAFAQSAADTVPGGTDVVTIMVLGGFTVLLALLYARQIKKTADAERALATERATVQEL